MQHIMISDIKIELVRKDIKHLHLGVYPPNGRVRVAAPSFVKDEAIRLFVISKLSWIKKSLRKFEGQERITPREYKNRESHYFQGKRYLLNVIEENASPKVEIRSKTYLDLYVRPKSPLKKRKEVMNEWYRTMLKADIPPLIEKWEEKMNVKVKEFGVKRMRTKWGTCNYRDHRIWLNLELAKKPIHLLEYVVVHEMIHLIEKSHNHRFKQLMDKYLPNWKVLRSELNKMPVEW